MATGDPVDSTIAAAPGSPEREMFHFADEPNNWPSMFGGSAWTQVPDGQWYLHLFDSSQPDWNWRNPAVPALFEQVLRFWLDRGAAGFRIDVGDFTAWAHRLASVGPGEFYDPGVFSDYPPGYLYVLWFIGSVGRALQPIIGADVTAGKSERQSGPIRPTRRTKSTSSMSG